MAGALAVCGVQRVVAQAAGHLVPLVTLCFDAGGSYQGSHAAALTGAESCGVATTRSPGPGRFSVPVDVTGSWK